MKMPDVNILVYAHRKDALYHSFYCSWLAELLNGPEPFALSPLVAVGFIRVVTNPSFPPNPTPLSQALAVIDTILDSDYCYQPELTKKHWSIVRHLCSASKSVGKLVADAQHAALAIEHGCTIITRDIDFKKFTPYGLRMELLKP